MIDELYNLEKKKAFKIENVVNKKIVITPLEGFIEQTRGYKNCVVSEAFDSRAIAEAILKSLNRKSVKDLVHIEKISIDDMSRKGWFF